MPHRLKQFHKQYCPKRRSPARSLMELARIATASPARRECGTSPERVRTDVSLMPRKLPFTRFTVKIRTPSLLPKSRPAGSRGESSIIWEQCRSMRIGCGVPVNSTSNKQQPVEIVSPENSPENSPPANPIQAFPTRPTPAAPSQRCSSCANLASNSSSPRKFCGAAGRQCSQHPASRSSRCIAASSRSCDDGLPAYKERSSIRARCSKLKSRCTWPTLHVWGMSLSIAGCYTSPATAPKQAPRGVLPCPHPDLHPQHRPIGPTQSPPTSVE